MGQSLQVSLGLNVEKKRPLTPRSSRMETDLLYHAMISMPSNLLLLLLDFGKMLVSDGRLQFVSKDNTVCVRESVCEIEFHLVLLLILIAK